MIKCDVIMTTGLWRHGGGPIYNALFLTKSSNSSTPELTLLTILTEMRRHGCKQVRDTENNNSYRASHGQYHTLELPNHGIKVEMSGYYYD